MDDKYADLRAVLDAEPTPGPWKANTSNEIGPSSKEDDQSFGMVLPVCFAEFENSEANRRYIAAYHPEAIRALLADYDQYRQQAAHETGVARAAVERVRALETALDTAKQSALDRGMDILKLQRIARTLEVEHDRLRDALAAVVRHLEVRFSPDGDNGPGHMHDIPGIWDLDNAKGLAGQPCEWCALWREVKALTQEQGGSDD